MEEVGEPTLMQALRAHRSEVTCVDVRGAWLVTGSGDRTLRLWRWAAGAGWQESTAAARAHRYGVTAARWAAAGVLLASAGVDGDVRLWCGRSLTARRVLAAPGATAVRALCWAGGARLAAGHDDGAVCVWSAARGALVVRLCAHEGAVHALAMPARSALLLTACTHGVLKVFDMAEVCLSGGSNDSPAPTPLLWIDGAHDLGALCANASDDGAVAATGGHDGVVRVWCVSEEAGARRMRAGPTLEGHAAAVTALCWATGTSRAILASASLDRTARLWEPAAAGACLRVLSAHTRYLTCVLLAPDLRYMITGSNDKSVRTWSLGEFSLDGELEPACAALAHFALGDLEQGIGPVSDESTEEAPSEDRGEGGEAVATVCAHAGAVNCVAVHGDLLATASSDGQVKIFRWCVVERTAREEHALEGHQYPALAVDFGAGGRVLVSAGLDGTACLWDVQTGVLLRSLCVPSGAAGAGGEVGGGGVRGARLSPHHAPLVLLATDDGLAPMWGLTSTSAVPDHVFAGHTEAVTCCAWSPDGHALATGAASGELRVHATPPASALHHEPLAHDLGVQSCDFAPICSDHDLPDSTYLLATGGCDSLIKLWIIELAEAGNNVSVRTVRQWEAHGGDVTSVRWGTRACSALLASAGSDRWARVWRVADAGGVVEPHAAVHTDGALVVALLPAPDSECDDAPVERGPLLTVGTLGGELVVWRVSAVERTDCEKDEGATPRWWGAPGVAHWLREYVTRPPGSTMSRDAEAELLQRARDQCITGAALLDEPLERLLADLGYGAECEIAEDGTQRSKEELERSETRARLRSELQWMRRAPPLPHLVSEALVDSARARRDAYYYVAGPRRAARASVPADARAAARAGTRRRRVHIRTRCHTRVVPSCGRGGVASVRAAAALDARAAQLRATRPLARLPRPPRGIPVKHDFTIDAKWLARRRLSVDT
ncbi:uncharacterized WD repeat-containing protein alr3466 isoform X3 [Manduca sexta]|uniref:uncharacterized WD repeat-containing protein alr3466 isoform X3 n=1 Tax=Manduca sexta TaxID=7130 RepID=UPI00188F305D|nr:uncharacterized WD repeat-containing protein alr3466 isoform X3 [Manduca sexta]